MKFFNRQARKIAVTNAKNPTAPPAIAPIGTFEDAADPDAVSTFVAPGQGAGVVTFTDGVSALDVPEPTGSALAAGVVIFITER